MFGLGNFNGPSDPKRYFTRIASEECDQTLIAEVKTKLEPNHQPFVVELSESQIIVSCKMERYANYAQSIQFLIADLF